MSAETTMSPFLDYSADNLTHLYSEDMPLDQFRHVYDKMHYFILWPLMLYGAATNIAVMAVLPKTGIHLPVNILLTALAAVNLVKVTSFMPMSLFRMGLWTTSEVFVWFSLVIYIGALTSQMVSTWLIVALALVRYLSLKSKLKSLPSVSNSRDCKILIMIIVVICILSSIPIYMSYNVLGMYNYVDEDIFNDTVNPSAPYEFYDISTNEFGVEHEFQMYLLYGILFKVVPNVVLFVFCGLLFREIIKYNRRKKELKTLGNHITSARLSEHNQITKMLLVTALILIILELPQGILTVMAAVDPEFKVVYNNFGNLMDVLALLSGTISFTLFCCMCKQFRRVFFKTFLRIQRMSSDGYINVASQKAHIRTKRKQPLVHPKQIDHRLHGNPNKLSTTSTMSGLVKAYFRRDELKYSAARYPRESRHGNCYVFPNPPGIQLMSSRDIIIECPVDKKPTTTLF